MICSLVLLFVISFYGDLGRGVRSSEKTRRPGALRAQAQAARVDLILLLIIIIIIIITNHHHHHHHHNNNNNNNDGPPVSDAGLHDDRGADEINQPVQQKCLGRQNGAVHVGDRAKIAPAVRGVPLQERHQSGLQFLCSLLFIIVIFVICPLLFIALLFYIGCVLFTYYFFQSGLQVQVLADPGKGWQTGALRGPETSTYNNKIKNNNNNNDNNNNIIINNNNSNNMIMIIIMFIYIYIYIYI